MSIRGDGKLEQSDLDALAHEKSDEARQVESALLQRLNKVDIDPRDTAAVFGFVSQGLLAPSGLNAALYLTSRILSIYREQELGEHDVFISYSRLDSAWVDSVQEVLEEAGYNIFRDTSNIQHGQAWIDKIERGIQKSRVFAMFLSKNYQGSEMCKREFEIAHSCYQESRCLIVPLRLDSFSPSSEYTRFQYIDVNGPGDPDASTSLLAFLATNGISTKQHPLKELARPMVSREAWKSIKSIPPLDNFKKDSYQRDWQRVVLPLPTGRSRRMPWTPNGVDQASVAMYECPYGGWTISKSDQFLLAGSVSNDPPIPVSSVNSLVETLRTNGAKGRFVRNLHIVASSVPDMCGFRIGSHRVQGFYDGLALGEVIANMLSADATISLWVGGSGNCDSKFGSVIQGLAMGANCLVAGLSKPELKVSRGLDNFWRACEFGQEIGDGTQSTNVWNIAYPSGDVSDAGSLRQGVTPKGPFES